jgi:calcineurin-like phosphoesterase family protein
LPGRLIAIGDLHGDISATRAALRLGGAIDDSDRWIGKDLTVVQTGDELDRGDGERDILDLFERLKVAAAASGGQVIALSGNHEIMNVQGDFRYVTPGGVTAFAGVRPRSPFAKSAPPPFEDRAAAFLPGGAYALELAKRDVIAVVGDSVFVHGGVLPAHVRYGIDRINRETRDWMSGGERRAPEVVASDDGPVWAREYSLDPVSASACEALAEVLTALHARRMVVGHTVQKSGITSACDDRVYRIDVGLSRYYGEGPIQVLEIRKSAASGSDVRKLSAPR